MIRLNYDHDSDCVLISMLKKLQKMIIALYNVKNMCLWILFCILAMREIYKHITFQTERMYSCFYYS